MNLIFDKWLPVIRKNGSTDEIAIADILKNHEDNPIVDIIMPRPDFRNSMYQLLIGVVQTAAMPDDEETWNDLWIHPYSNKEFKDKLEQYRECFEIDSDGPAFMQDFNLDTFTEEKLTNIFLDLPGNEHFNKNIPQKINPYWACLALYSLQTFGPAGGRGHKTGLRGGGPLTTILVKQEGAGVFSNLWHTLWINIFPKEFVSNNLSGNPEKKEFSDIFPWMKPTKISGKDGTGLFPTECNPLHMYFAMPRRIRLVFDEQPGYCDITGRQSKKVVTGYKTFHSGNDYQGHWIHPLNAYKTDSNKNEDPPNPVKGNPGCVTYKNWAGMALLNDDSEMIQPPIIAYCQIHRRKILRQNQLGIWVAGYDLKNIKASRWYESTFPIFPVVPKTSQELASIAGDYVQAALKILSGLRQAVKISWYKNPREIKGDMSFINEPFWQMSENSFFLSMQKLADDIENEESITDCTKKFFSQIKTASENLFERWSLSNQEDGMDMSRAVKGLRTLEININYARAKILNNLMNLNHKGGTV
jgi:CRISPR system Cascade subunit CasA